MSDGKKEWDRREASGEKLIPAMVSVDRFELARLYREAALGLEEEGPRYSYYFYAGHFTLPKHTTPVFVSGEIGVPSTIALKDVYKYCFERVSTNLPYSTRSPTTFNMTALNRL